MYMCMRMHIYPLIAKRLRTNDEMPISVNVRAPRINLLGL